MSSTSSTSMSSSAATAQSYIVDDYSYIASSSMMATSGNNNIVSLDPRVIAGSVGSLVSSVVSQPFEVAKVRQQSSAYHLAAASSSSSALYASTSGAGHSSPGAIATLRNVIAKEGFRGAYAGMAPTIMMSIPNYVLYLTAYDDIVDRLRAPSSPAATIGLQLSENSIPLVGGALARLLATTAVAPFEMLRTREASRGASHNNNQHRQSSVISELGKIVRQDGVGALYKGIVPSLSRDVPFAAIYMLCLERFRDATRPVFFPNHDSTSSSSISDNPQRQVTFEFVNAALAGMVAASCTAPLDYLKTHRQSAGHQLVRGQQQPTPTLDIVRSTLHREGLSGLWRGNQARMMKVAPQYAIMISFYEVGKKVLAPQE